MLLGMSRDAAESGANARQRVRWARRGLDGCASGPYNVLGELSAVVYATNELESAAVLYVAAARDRGCSWADIGCALGVSRQAARQRYAGAMRRRDLRRADWLRASQVSSGVLDVRERRGVWDGTVERARGAQHRD